MKNALSHILTMALLAAAPLSVSVTPAAAQSACWDRSQIQAAVAEGRIRDVGQVRAREGIPSSTEVLDVKVCEQGGTLVYVLTVYDASGETRDLTLNAQ
ncbi:hypothetical protein [Pelagibacterium halotolerans]|uniref:hypothetical protein n=1 Tax=Pelagibacterium halotolerans TaxID=531813 RepID=UPI00384C76D8